MKFSFKEKFPQSSQKTISAFEEFWRNFCKKFLPLFVIIATACDIERAVDLFNEDHAHHAMGESHF